MLRFKGTNNVDGSFNWRDAVIDAAIIAGVTFFSSLGGMALAGIPTLELCFPAAIAAGTQFCLTLAIKRGLREAKPAAST
jgi:hypothetical protein